MFQALYFGSDNVFIGAPTSCGKTVAAELAVLQLARALPGLRAVYVAPMKALVRERYLDWRARYGRALGARVAQLTGDTLPTPRALAAAALWVATPEKLDALARQRGARALLRGVGLVVFDEVQLVGTARGHVLEALAARLAASCPRTRLVAMSTASPNAADVARWLRVPPRYVFNFDAEARPARL